ncbi:MAG: alpha/beta hydrolase [Bacteroidetes bacterium]|nr:MAG: alpha/beta hydrolase [Bacteroidota bacterium]
MSSKKIKFQNSNGQTLSARLELPDKETVKHYALFAHCFTCNKNLSAVRNISRSLNEYGIAALRFDFTGLGESEGEFADTNFSSNVQDLIEAAKFLENEYESPSLLIGHSLGGAAVIFAAAEITSVKAVAVIGAPSSPAHVKHLLQGGIEDIEKYGSARISIGGRPFNVSKQFLQDIQSKNMDEVLKNLRKPLIILHSPQDTIVSIKQAEDIYKAARHPKSYISMDGADHLLSNSKDSHYAGKVIAGWADRYL